MLHQSLFDNGNELKYGAQSERAEGDAEKTFAQAQDPDSAVYEAELIESGGDTKPEKMDSPMIWFTLQYRAVKAVSRLRLDKSPPKHGIRSKPRPRTLISFHFICSQQALAPTFYNIRFPIARA